VRAIGEPGGFGAVGVGSERAVRNDHITLRRIKSTKINILGRHQEASASVSKHFQPL